MSSEIDKVRSTNKILIAAIVIAAFFLGSLTNKVATLGKNGSAQAGIAPTAPTGNPQVPQAPTKVTVGIGHFPVLGDKNAKVTVVVFADLRCPYCEKFYTDTESQIIKDYVDTGKIKFAFRDYAFLGPASTVAANAAECANEQGKFWEMYNYLYKNQPPETDTSMYTVDNLTQIAGTLGMKTDQFNSCLSANKYQKNVDQDLADGQKAGVTGTPATFINGQIIMGAQPYANFKAAIDQALAGK